MVSRFSAFGKTLVLGAAEPSQVSTEERRGSLGSTASQNGSTQSHSRESTNLLNGTDGATSLKAEIVGRVPELQDASQFREVRRLLREELGGVGPLREELVFSGFVDPETHMLTTNDKPLNVFAQVSTGKIHQPGMSKEQQALGTFKDRFVICCNRPDNDLHWDSNDQAWIKRASMARRHRFLTTKDLHFKWFNALVFGMVHPDDGGCTIREALDEVLAMKTASLQYAKQMGWSSNVGLFVNVFGHNSVNSLFVHVLDLEETGPAFEALDFKNLPLDDVIKVLQEEVSLKITYHASRKKPELKRRHTFFAGTEGATSLKEEMIGRIPVLRDSSGVREARRMLLEELGGSHTLREELARAGLVDRSTNSLCIGVQPFNVFARCAGGAMEQPGMNRENEALGEFKERFMICCNRPENDEHWDSEDPAWVGKASMSRRHRFLTTKNLHWQWFNALVFGLVDEDMGGQDVRVAVAELESMKAAALTFTSRVGGWSEQIGLFFHVFGHNSVNSLHLHIVDMAHLGPTFWKYDYKNCPLESVLKVLKEEVNTKFPASISQLTTAAVEAATAAAEAAQVASSAVASVSNSGTGHRRPSLTRPALGPVVMNRQSSSREGAEVLDLNVGGELLLSIARSTLLLAPEGSYFHSMFGGGWDAIPLQRDREGRIFLDFPPQPFRRIIDHLRLINFAPEMVIIQPPVLPRREEQDVRLLAGALGIEDFISEPKCGRRQVNGPVEIVQVAGPETHCGKASRCVIS